MKRIKKRLTALVMAAVLCSNGIVGQYEVAQAGEIVAGYSIAQILEGLLASFGISLFTAEMVQHATSPTWWETDGSAALKPYYDDLEAEYERERFKVINGGGGNPEPSPTPIPEQTPEVVPTPAPGEAVPGDIPTFSELVAPLLAGGVAAIELGQGAWECLGKAVSSLWSKCFGIPNSFSSLNEDDVKLLLNNSGHPYYNIYDYYSNDLRRYRHHVFLIGVGSYVIQNGHYKLLDVKYYIDGELYQSFSYQFGANFFSANYKNHIYNMSVFSTEDEAEAWSLNEINKKNNFSKEVIWTTPDLQDTYKNNGQLEYPQQAPRPLTIPSNDQLAELIRKLNPEINTEYSPEMAPNYIKEFIEQLKPNVNPDPNPDPDPTPDPDPDPNPDPNPDPELSPAPDPDLTPIPEDPENPDVDPDAYKADLRDVFPFCIPFDLIRLLKVFQAEPRAPVFEIPVDLEFNNPFNSQKIIDYHEVFVLDFADFEEVAKIFRAFQVVLFIIGLLMITRSQMIKG